MPRTLLFCDLDLQFQGHWWPLKGQILAIFSHFSPGLIYRKLDHPIAGIYTVAALCIAHAFESTHPQSYAIAHKLLICCFEVNFLHKHPIIGETCLIYSRFQQNCPYFSSYVTFYCIEICLPTTYFTSSRCVLKRGFPKFGLFLRNARLIFVVVNAHPQLLQIFGHIAHGRYRAWLQ